MKQAIPQAEPRAQKQTAKADRMPVLFIGHGAPFLATDAEKGGQFTAWARALPRPKAVLALSAHWVRLTLEAGPTEQVPLIYDFGGFPRELYEIQWPAPPAAALVGRLSDQLKEPVKVSARRGLDHGAWTPLKWMWPDHDVPVSQLALPGLDADRLMQVGRALAPLRDEGVLIVASGNVTHNLRRMDISDHSGPPAWASEFDQWVTETVSARDLDLLRDYQHKAPATRLAHPTVEHFSPLLMAAAAAEDEAVRFPITGWEYGSISRRCVQFG